MTKRKEEFSDDLVSNPTSDILMTHFQCKMKKMLMSVFIMKIMDLPSTDTKMNHDFVFAARNMVGQYLQFYFQTFIFE